MKVVRGHGDTLQPSGFTTLPSHAPAAGRIGHPAQSPVANVPGLLPLFLVPYQAMQILFASSNPHKLDEVRSILAPNGFEIIGLQDLDTPINEEPIEDGGTFKENARIKARFYAARSGRVCLADDSGLEVDALDGAPGVHSARYAEMESERQSQLAGKLTRDERDRANNQLLLQKLRDVPPDRRAARFVCAMCAADPEGRVLAETRGTFEGVITEEPRGENGFGYDPLLCLPDVGCTSAELSPEAKNARSHRGAAARAMAEALRGISC